MAEMMWIDGDVHAFLKRTAKKNGSTIQKVASTLLRQARKGEGFAEMEFPQAKKRGRKAGKKYPRKQAVAPVQEGSVAEAPAVAPEASTEAGTVAA